MKNLAFIFIFLFTVFSLRLMCQVADFSSESVLFDTNLLSSKPILGQKLTFRDYVYYTGYDSINGCYYVNTIHNHQFSKNTYGSLLFIDPDKQITKWTKGIVLGHNELVLSDKLALDLSYGKTKCYKLSDGSEIWQCPNLPLLVDFRMNLALTKYCDKKNCYDSLLNAIQMETGNSMWTIALNTDYGIIDDVIINDSIVVVEANGLIAISTKRGEIWTYKASTGQDIRAKKSSILDPSEYLPSNFDGFFTQPKQKVIAGISSNILYDSNYIYFASRSDIVKIEPVSGRIMWKEPLLEYYSSNSTLINSDTLIFLINNGMAFTYDRDAINYIDIHGTLRYGNSYITAYSKATGEQKFFNLINNSCITDQKLKNDTLVILFRNGLSLYSAHNGKELDSIKIGEENTDGLKFMAGGYDFLEKDNQYIPVKDYYPEHYFAKTQNDMLFIFDKNLNFKKYIVPNKRLIRLSQNKEYQLIAKDPSGSKESEFFLLNSANQLVCSLKRANYARITNNKLLVCRDHDLIIINLNEIQ